MKLQCPVPDCTYKTEDLTDASLLTALLNLHATAHAKPATAAETAPAPPEAPIRIRELERPTISLAANSEDWAYFIILWEEYRIGSRLDDQDVVLQLLECWGAQKGPSAYRRQQPVDKVRKWSPWRHQKLSRSQGERHCITCSITQPSSK